MEGIERKASIERHPETPSLKCVLELYMIYYNTCRCFWLFESDCTQLCKYIHIFVKFGPRQYEKRDVS